LVFQNAVAIGPSRRTRKNFFSKSVQDGTPILFYGVPSTPGCLCGSVRTAAQTPWRTAANYSDLSTRWHITGSPVGKVPNGLRLRLNYTNVTHLVWVFTCMSQNFLK